MPLLCIKRKIRGGPDIPALFTKPPSSSYKYSEKYDVYAKDVTKLVNLPPPNPPQKLKKEVLDLSEYLMVDDKAIRVPLTILSKPLDALVQYLIDGYDDDISKARVLYRWITNQPINKMKVLERKPKDTETALWYLWMLKMKKKRYTQVFNTLCRYAGLYCVVIHGLVKGVHYQIGEKIDNDKHYGEWNAVLVEGEWRLVDTLWGACDAKDLGDGKGRFTCDDRFFFTDPKDLIYTHFALAEKWQLLDSPRHIESFEESACLKNRFFDFGMHVLSHPNCEIESIDGEVDLLFGCQPKTEIEQTFGCYISFFDRPETKRFLSKGSNSSVPIFIHRMTDSSVAIKVRFPEKGVYRLEVVAKQVGRGAVYKEYDWVAIYKVLVEESANRGFPKMDPIGWGPGPEIGKIGLVPFNYTSGVIVAKSTNTKIRFKITDTHSVQNMKFFFKMASTYDNDYSLNTVSDKFEIDINIMTFFIEAPPFGEYTLKMYARNVRGNVPHDQRREINICNYLLISDLPQRETPLAVLTEKTELFDDVPAPVPEKKIEAAESVVSASNVVMDTKPSAADSIPSTPRNLVQEQPPPKKPLTPEKPKETIKKPLTPEKPKEPPKEEAKAQSKPEQSKKAPGSQSKTPEAPKPDPKQEKQTFVRVDGNIQEIPEIPLNVVNPVAKETEPFVPEKKQEMKAVSSNRVVPLNPGKSGGDDDSIMLVPVEDKTKRPNTGFKRSRDDIKFFTALARVRGEP